MGHLTQVANDDDDDETTTVYGSHFASTSLPKYEMPEDEMPARTAARFVQDELLMDGNPSLNLASFVSTYMEEECVQLMAQNLSKNFIDVEEYPACAEIETRSVNMIASLFNAPRKGGQPSAMGVSTVGSSEAIILAVLAAKRRWRNARKAAGKSTESPNIVMNAAVQVCWEKAARYLEVEERYWYCTDNRFIYDPKEMVELVDENTIMVCSILGTTYTGQYEDTKALNALLEEKNKKDNLDVWIHVDAASGGFVAPFVVPDLEWDFRLSRVCSINVSGHKYGLVYAGVGWAIWRNKSFLPDEILFEVNYLGSPQVSFTLNFSKSAVQVIGQYYMLIRFGKSGFRAVMSNLTTTADYISQQIASYGNGQKFTILSETAGKGLPLVAWRLTNNEHYDEFAIARKLRSRGWIVPAYTMAPHAKELKLLRVVIREDFSRSRAESFLRDLTNAVEYCERLPPEALTAISKANEIQSEAQGSKPAQSGSRSHRQLRHDRHHEHKTTEGGKVVVNEKHSLAKHGKTQAIC